MSHHGEKILSSRPQSQRDCSLFQKVLTLESQSLYYRVLKSTRILHDDRDVLPFLIGGSMRFYEPLFHKKQFWPRVRCHLPSTDGTLECLAVLCIPYQD